MKTEELSSYWDESIVFCAWQFHVDGNERMWQQEVWPVLPERQMHRVIDRSLDRSRQHKQAAVSWLVSGACAAQKDAGGKDKSRGKDTARGHNRSQLSPNREIKCQVCAGCLFANISKIHLYLLASCAVCLCSAHCALVPQTFTLIVYKYFGSNKAKTPVGHMPGKWASRLWPLTPTCPLIDTSHTMPMLWQLETA